VVAYNKGENMNADVKKLWINALRSGEYKQGKHYLREEDRFCCLGVLCDIAIKMGIPLEANMEFSGRFVYGKDTQYLPQVVQKWAGLYDKNPIVSHLSNSLAQLNDHNDMTFEDIANAIELGL
jgi:hypothetical protein